MPRTPSYLLARETIIQPRPLVHTGEFAVVMKPRNWRYDNSVPTVIYCAALGAGAVNLFGWAAYFELVRRGFSVACADLSDVPTAWGKVNGPGVWGNNTSLSRGNELITWCETNLKTDPTKLILMGGSMGGITSAVLARDNLDKCIGIAWGIPTVDVEDIRANNRNSYQASIETAYTNNAGWQTARPTHNPVEIADDLAGVPVYNTYGTADTICLESTQEAFEAAHGNTTMVPMAGVRHTTASVDWTAMVDWMEALA